MVDPKEQQAWENFTRHLVYCQVCKLNEAERDMKPRAGLYCLNGQTFYFLWWQANQRFRIRLRAEDA